jgi:RNA polymerase sigma-70 factor (ECF subfamily)
MAELAAGESGHLVDRSEFEQLALEHLEAIYRMALQLTRHPDEASDLVQETYLRALRVADRFEERGGGIRPGLFRILHNGVYTRLARARRGPTPVEELVGEDTT